LPDGEAGGQRCTHHGFRAKAKFLCTLRLQIETLVNRINSNNSSYLSVLNENWDESETGSDSGIFAITN